MRRESEDDFAKMPGQDSFLDVVANMVGIMILLVMIMGVRASSAADPAGLQRSPAEAQPLVTADDVQAAERTAAAAERDLLKLAQQARDMRGETLLRNEERNMLATMVVAGEKEIVDRRARLSEEKQRDFDLRRQLGEAQKQLDDMAREQISLLSQEPDVEVVEALPTPLAKTVSGEEVHLRLASGHVAVVPIDKLQKEGEAHFERNMWRLREQPSMEGTVGPIDGFRLRYRIRLTRVVVPSQSGFHETHNVPQMRFEYLPTTPDVGEPLDQSVLPNSDMLSTLRSTRAASTTITIWFYPDSFNEFRQLKKALFDLGFAAAGRPLPAGQQISASPSGTKSAAQ